MQTWLPITIEMIPDPLDMPPLPFTKVSIILFPIHSLETIEPPSGGRRSPG